VSLFRGFCSLNLSVCCPGPIFAYRIRILFLLKYGWQRKNLKILMDESLPANWVSVIDSLDGLRGLRGLLAGLLGSTSVATGLSDAYALS
jgi:hypothetical protein